MERKEATAEITLITVHPKIAITREITHKVRRVTCGVRPNTVA
jgi:hypothetical protein